VCYGGDLGPDLDDVARAHGLTADEVIELHSGAVYLVYMVGFNAGLRYLGGVAGANSHPRRKTPRTAVPAGTVGIADDRPACIRSSRPALGISSAARP
jgi:inhibitor of KinA